jgi:hypothetical protein
MNAMANVIPLKDLTPKTERSSYLKATNGDAIGSGFHVPKGDFARFLGYKPPTDKEAQGDVTGGRVLEVALQKQFNEVGQATAKTGHSYNNLWIASGRYEKVPGQEKAAIAANMDAMNQSLEVGQATNMRYLEMQYKFQYMSRSFGTISNLMKARNDSVKKAINEVK